MRSPLSPAVALLLLAPLSAGSQQEVFPQCPEVRCAPGRICRPCGPPAVVRVASHVVATLRSGAVSYEIRETFINHGPAVGEADYLLPLPRNAVFRDLRLFIDGEPIAGEVMDASRARSIYEEIVRRQRDPALVEWIGHGLLRTRIFPIAPGERKEVTVRYDAVAEREGDALRIDYFRAQRGGGTPGWRVIPAGVSATGDEVAGESFTLQYPSALGRAWSPTHHVAIRDSGRVRHAVVTGEQAHMTLMVPVPRTNAAALTALTHASGSERHVMLTFTPPPATGRRIPRDVTLVVDVSGSMSGEKIRQARSAGVQLLGSLDSTDRFRVIDFAGGVQSFRPEFVRATQGNVAAAVRYIRALQASGGTNIEGALTEALRTTSAPERLPLILFMTDGLPTVGERNADVLAAMVARRRGTRRIFTFGVGTDVNVALLEQLAIDGRGTAHFVRNDESIEHALGVVASRLAEPVLTDVTVEARGVRLRDVYPTLPTDVFAGQDLVLLARYEGSGRGQVRVSGRSAGRQVTFELPASFPDDDRRDGFVPRLWAMRRIGYLMAERRGQPDTRELDQEIRDLALRYGLPTDQSSYLVMEPGMTPDRVLTGTARTERQLDAPAAISGPLQLSSVVTTGAAAFESARAAADQRAAVTTGSVSATAGRRVAAGRTFELRDSVWVQVLPAAAPGVETIRIRPYSAAYFEIMRSVPEIRDVFALGERVVAHGRGFTMELSEQGRSDVTPALLERLARGW